MAPTLATVATFSDDKIMYGVVFVLGALRSVAFCNEL